MEAAKPYLELFAIEIASRIEETPIITNTGPKISSLAMEDSGST
jgi:hypothetical protein